MQYCFEVVEGKQQLCHQGVDVEKIADINK